MDPTILIKIKARIKAIIAITISLSFIQTRYFLMLKSLTY